jgi:hypothetical protein
VSARLLPGKQYRVWLSNRLAGTVKLSPTHTALAADIMCVKSNAAAVRSAPPRAMTRTIDPHKRRGAPSTPIQRALRSVSGVVCLCEVLRRVRWFMPHGGCMQAASMPGLSPT